MSTLTLLLDDEAAAETLRADLIKHGIADADILVFAGEAGVEPLSGLLTGLHLEPDDLDAKTRHVAEGGALVAVRVTDETHQLVKRILEGRPDEEAAVETELPHAADPGANVVDIDGQETRMSSAQ